MPCIVIGLILLALRHLLFIWQSLTLTCANAHHFEIGWRAYRAAHAVEETADSGSGIKKQKAIENIAGFRYSPSAIRRPAILRLTSNTE